MDFALGAGVLRDRRMEQPFQTQRSIREICAGLWRSKRDPAKSPHLRLA
jgi:hypothetical protein